LVHAAARASSLFSFLVEVPHASTISRAAGIAASVFVTMADSGRASFFAIILAADKTAGWHMGGTRMRS
jgi:hypothetical protein